jgi:hypothetical protein
MTIEEQNVFLSREYAEAVRYMDNAKEALRKAKKEDDGYYNDSKYVRTACGVAYSGVLVALDAWLKLKGVELSKRQRKSIEYYTDNIAKLDGKMSKTLRSAYNILHLVGYYDGETKVKIIEVGFEDAYEIISKIKPENPVEVKDTRINAAKRAINKMMLSFAVMFK